MSRKLGVQRATHLRYYKPRSYLEDVLLGNAPQDNDEPSRLSDLIPSLLTDLAGARLIQLWAGA